MLYSRGNCHDVYHSLRDSPATGYIDIQVNGFGGINYNEDNLTAEKLHASCEKLQATGVAGILATICSEQPDVMIRRLANVVKARAADPLSQKIIAGIHTKRPYMQAPKPATVALIPSKR